MVNTVHDPALEQPADGSPADQIDEGRADAVGRRHTVAGDNARIVSLVPSLTELLVDLGLGQQLAEIGQRLDDLAGQDARVDEIQKQNADLAERTNKLVETYVERSLKRYAKAVATYVQKDAVRLADQMAEKHVLALRDELVRAQVEAGHKSVPLVPTVLATVALIAALGALLLVFF